MQMFTATLFIITEMSETNSDALQSRMRLLLPFGERPPGAHS